MELYIQHVVEPKRLLLAWQAPDHMNSRRRWVVAHVDVTARPWTMDYLEGVSFQNENPGASYSELLALGFEGYPAFRRRRDTITQGVQEALMRRLPPRSRTDFPTYIQRFGFMDDSALSDAALLAYTEAKLPSDGFSLVGELDCDSELGDFIFDIAGTRHQAFGDHCPAVVGDALTLKKEPSNEHDPFAIEVLWQEIRLGYINRLQAKVVGFWMENRDLQVSVQRINGRSGSPKVYALIRVRPSKSSIAA